MRSVPSETARRCGIFVDVRASCHVERELGTPRLNQILMDGTCLNAVVQVANVCGPTDQIPRGLKIERIVNAPLIIDDARSNRVVRISRCNKS